MSAERKQSGLAHDYTEYVQEVEKGVTPADPDFQPISDNMRTVWDGEVDASTEPQNGLGSRDPRGFFNGPEEHEFTFVYDLQRWYVDTSGNTQDPAGDIMKDTPDNDLNATHTVVTREVHVSGGPDGAGRYIYTVGKGGHPSELTVPFETEDGLPVPQELAYRFEKVREYSIGQPGSTVEIAVESTSDNDTSQDVTIESDGGATVETITLNGTTTVDTTSTFDSIESIELSEETEGNVIFGTSDGTTSPSIVTQLGEIQGANEYDGIEGDLGVPTIGSGSHGGTIGSDYLRFREDRIQYSNGDDIAPEISSGELVIDQGIDSTGQDESVRQSIDVGNRETTFTASLAGHKPSVDQMVRYLTETPETVEWIPNTTADHKLELPNARLITPGEIGRETDSVKLIVESEWQSEGVNVS